MAGPIFVSPATKTVSPTAMAPAITRHPHRSAGRAPFPVPRVIPGGSCTATPSTVATDLVRAGRLFGSAPLTRMCETSDDALAAGSSPMPWNEFAETVILYSP